jgi:acetyltransferase-like isoleucine patch superfamily enzyme
MHPTPHDRSGVNDRSGFSAGRVLRLAWDRPGPTLRAALAIARGFYYRLRFRLTGQRVIIGRRFRVQGRLEIKGPGTVIFGDDCGVVSSRMAVTTPYTHSPEAVIRFGNRVLLTGTRLSCQARIDVGDGAGLSDARIMDTDFHALETGGRLRYNTGGVAKPITIGPNAWLGAGSMVLKGVSIGENSVVGAGAVVASKVPPDCVVFGNPARVIWRLRGNAARTVAPTEAAALQPTPES